MKGAPHNYAPSARIRASAQRLERPKSAVSKAMAPNVSSAAARCDSVWSGVADRMVGFRLSFV